MIDREDRDWGVRLSIRPFSTKKHATLEIRADVHKPPAGQKQEVWFSFRGVTPQEGLRMTDARIWQSAMAAIIAEAEKVAEELAPKEKAARKKAARKRR